MRPGQKSAAFVTLQVDRGFDMHEITAMLPPFLQEEVFYNVHAPLLRKVPMFEGCDHDFNSVTTVYRGYTCVLPIGRRL